MASYNKNVFVGTGGSEGINKSHFLGACYGMERIMGRADTPVRKVLNYASDHFAKHLPIVYVLTVVGATQGGQVTRGLFIGDDIECFNKACELALKVNFTMLDEPLKKVVVYLDPEEFKSTWLGNKSIYRTRMAMADGGQLIVLAPGLKEFGEDKGIDKMIRKYGYVGTPKLLQLVRDNDDLRASLGAAAHLIHGSTEGRFTVTYCPGSLTKQEIESVNMQYADLRTMMAKYDPNEAEKRLQQGRRRGHLLHLQPRLRPVVHAGTVQVRLAQPLGATVSESGVASVQQSVHRHTIYLDHGGLAKRMSVAAVCPWNEIPPCDLRSPLHLQPTAVP